MKKRMLLITVLGAVLVVVFGCSMVQDAITPCFIEPRAIDYSGEKSTSFVPYTTLLDAERIDSVINYKHIEKQVEYLYASEADVRLVSWIQGRSTLHKAAAQEFKQNFFSPTGPMGLLLAGVPCFGLGAMLISKKSDKDEIARLKNGA